MSAKLLCESHKYNTKKLRGIAKEIVFAFQKHLQVLDTFK